MFKETSNHEHILHENDLGIIVQCKKCKKIAKKNNVMCGVIFQNRFNQSIQLIKKTLDKGDFGKIVNVSLSLLWCRYQKYYDDKWHGTWKNDGGVINQQLIHR